MCTVTVSQAAFLYNTGLTQFNFPDSLRVIEPYAMSFTYITEANLPEGITEIGAYAFFGCHYLADVQLPSTLEVIGNDAFGMIDDLKEITIPANVTTIGSGALSYCESLESVTFEGNAPTVVIADGSQSNFVINDATVYYPGDNATWTAEAMDAIGKNVTWIPYCVHVEETVPGKTPTCDEDGLTEGVKCADCGEMLVEQEVIPATGHNYEDHFCAVCGSKEPGYVVLSGKCGDDLYWTIEVEEHILRITGTGEMYDGSILDEHYEDTFALLDHEQWPKQLVIEEGATTIGESAFANLDTLETASLPNTLVKIGSRAFVYCFELAEIEIPSGVSEIGEKAFALTAIETISIPEGVTVLAGGTFWECDALTDVSLPSTLKTIGVAAFESCNSLSEIEIPDGVETIESAAFVNCSGLRELVIPASVVELGDCIVSADYTEGFALESITFEGDMPQLTGENEGEYCFYNTTIYYPGDNATWTEEAMAAIGSNVNWVPYYTECQHVERVVAGSAATCTVPGLTIGKICDLCGEVLAEQTVIPALGHTEVPVPGKASTCIKSGISDGSYCSVCNAVIVEQMTISATGHTKAVDAAVAATCTTAGWTEGAHCSVCNATITMQKKISALGHTEVSVAGTAPTCTASGLSEGTKCSVCDAVLVAQTFIPMLGHNEVSDPAVEATCQDPGLTEGAHCTVCGEVTLAQEETPLGDHLFGNWTNVKMPTVEAEGESRRACVFCGKIETKVLEKLNESFNDVSNDDWYVNEVAWAVSIGVTTGTSADSFSPDNDCTRAQVVTFLWRAAGSPDPASTNNPFTDVVEGAYYYEAVLWAVENGITTGMSSTEFGTDNACTRAQVVTFLCRTAGSPVANQSSNPFADVLATMYYYNAVLWAVEMGITTGMSATSFAPDGICNRAQIVTFLYRYINGTV